MAGDAAHSFPPTGGLGVNTGVADVHNLAWKIHAIEQDWTDQFFLATVSSERRPVALANATQSRFNEGKIFRLAGAILKPGTSAEQLMADPVSRQQIKQAIEDNYDHFHSDNLQLGYVYGKELTHGPNDYQKELIPGVRLPHTWISNQGQKISMLDLISGTEFVLIAPKDFTDKRSLDVQGVPILVQQLGRDFKDNAGDWGTLATPIGRAAILVRPDHHIVSVVATVDEAESAVGAYLRPTVS